MDIAAKQSVENMSVRELIDLQAENNGAAPYLIDPQSGEHLNFLQLQRTCFSVARFIEDKGINKGDSVAFAMHNGLTCAVTILGIMYGGYRAVAVNLVAGRDVIAYVLDHSESSLILTQSEQTTLINEALNCDVFESGSTKPVVHVIEQYPTVDEAGTNVTANGSTLPDAHDDALLMYTSGTTGRPKGVVLSHSNVIAGGCNVGLGHELQSRDRALCVLPLYHINGLCVTLSFLAVGR